MHCAVQSRMIEIWNIDRSGSESEPAHALMRHRDRMLNHYGAAKNGRPTRPVTPDARRHPHEGQCPSHTGSS